MQTCEYPVTWKLFRREAFEEQLRGHPLAVNRSLLVLSLFFLFVLTTGRYFWFFLPCLLFLLYFLLLHWLVRARRKYKTYSILWGGADWRRTVVFRQTSLIVTEGRAAKEVSFRNVAKIREKPGEALIVFGGGGVFLIRTDCFTDGAWEQAREKIRALSTDFKKVRT